MREADHARILDSLGLEPWQPHAHRGPVVLWWPHTKEADPVECEAKEALERYAQVALDLFKGALQSRKAHRVSCFEYTASREHVLLL